VAPPVFKSPSARVERLIGTVATISAQSAMAWLRLNSRSRTMSRYFLLLIAGSVFHFAGIEIYSRPSPELASGLLASAECKGRRRFQSPAGATPRRLRTKILFCGMLTLFCREKSTRIWPSSYPFENETITFNRYQYGTPTLGRSILLID
jgi:hypothetical protein